MDKKFAEPVQAEDVPVKNEKIMDKTFAEPVQAEDVTVKNEKITDDTSDKEFVFVLDDTEVYTELYDRWMGVERRYKFYS